jgi:hypothetical protein
MISDTLSEAVEAMDEYLTWPTYSGDEDSERELRARIVSVRDQMDALRAELDRPPVPSA